MSSNSANNSPNPAEAKSPKQIAYRDARFEERYDEIWQSVGKCVFCDMRDKYIFFEENGIVMTVSLFAYIDGHLMIVPRRHVRTTKELNEREWETIRKFTYIAKKLIRQIHGVKGMQLVEKEGATAQSTVSEHLHFHCIPFDAPDLSTWNYRRLKYTPLESANLYRSAGKKILSLGEKFSERYRSPDTIRLVCDAVIINAQNEVLFQERVAKFKLDPDWLTLPGGGIHRFDQTLELELNRELEEEIGHTFEPEDLKLLDSRLGHVTYKFHEAHLDATYKYPMPIMWNSYLVRTQLAPSDFTPGDDCAAIVWLSIEKAIEHPRVSPQIQKLLRRIER